MTNVAGLTFKVLMNSQYGQNLSGHTVSKDNEKILRILLLVSLGCIIASKALGYDKCCSFDVQGANEWPE